MDATITYSLRDGQRRSDAYYPAVAAFTDEMLAEADRRMRPLIEAFRADTQRVGKLPRTGEEYVLELLTLGVLWRVYAGDACRLAGGPRWALTRLARPSAVAPASTASGTTELLRYTKGFLSRKNTATAPILKMAILAMTAWGMLGRHKATLSPG